MATTTTYYGMSKPTLLEAADIRVINGDIDTIDRVMHSHMVSMAPVFDPASTYDVGDLVMYNDILYRCKTAISTPAAWDATKWDATNIVDEFPEGGGGGSIDYSTTEQNTGQKWIDGKDIYQITIQTSLPLVTADGTMAYADISFTGVDSVIKLNAQFSDANSVYFAPYLSNGLRIVKTYYNKSTQKIMLATDSTSFSESPCIVTIQYTKTSS